jgi:AraC family transcriptional regulator
MGTAAEYKKRTCRAMNFISRNLDRELSLEEIAREASFSMYHFHRIFKAVVGETVAGFTRRLLPSSHL